MDGPLKGIRVIEIGQALAGPLAGAIMADMGADVIKVEKPDGGDDARGWGPPFIEEASIMFHVTNRNKRSVTLDMKSPDGVAKLKDLVRDADILIQNLRSGVVAALGIGPQDMTAINPRLIYCSIWAFGPSGPLSRAPGFDPLLQAFSGVMMQTGRHGDPPTFCAPAINDKATAQWCVIGALAALQQRHVTGKGCVIDTSLLDSAAAWVDTSLATYHVTQELSPRTGTAASAIVPYQVFETADSPMVIAAGYDRLFHKCAAVLGYPEWATDPRFARGRDRFLNRDVLIDLMSVVLRTKTRGEWISAFEAVGVPCSPVNTIVELSQTEQFKAVDLVRTLPGSGLPVIGLPISFDGQRPHPQSGAPKLGEHNDEVLGG
ncbi:CaiB/BaiF CoA transferase family protein [Bradyrhizobium sp. SYSU BS000235]|uniref:CaiB/BaiF CoA transferase family protein n=1 Tax=Bradyrhizobium sp. SYSU BS000235 TaxID=3411332 RepID=UPI003C73BF02